ncbi:MAG: PAS domain S-box protein [Deltaproteobacteria bacterium]|nr:PAS domain S-box protein [Deltaproteobacteria bacterium]
MAKTALARFTDDRRAELAGSFARLFADAFPDEIEDERNRTARLRKIAAWAIGLFQLLAENLNNPNDTRVFEYQKTLIHSGDLASFGVPDLVKSCLLINRTFQIVWQDVPGPRPASDDTERIRQAVEELVLSAAGFFDEKLRQNDRFVDGLFEGADLIFMMLDTGGRIARVNDLVATLFGKPREELISRGLAGFVHEDDLPLVTRSVGLVLAGTPRIFEMRVRGAGEQTRILHVFLTPLTETGQIVGMRLVAQDVTKQKTLQDALRRSEEKFHALLEHSPSPILIVRTEDGSLIEINRRGAEVVGIDEGQVRAASLLDVFQKDSGRAAIELLQAAIHYGTAEASGLGLRTGQQSWTRVNVSASAIEYGADRVVQLVLSESPPDVESVPHHDPEEAEREVRRLRDDAVRAALDLALARLERDARHWMHAQFRADSEANAEPRASRVGQVLDLLERLEFRRTNRDGLVDLAGGLEDLVALLREIYGRRIVFHLRQSELFRVADNYDRVLPAVSAVILAAVEATRSGDIYVRGEMNGGLNIIQVMDTGEQIPHEGVEIGRVAGNPAIGGRRHWDLYRDALCAMENAGGGLQIRPDRLGGARVTLTIPGARWDEVSEPAPHTLMVLPDMELPAVATDDSRDS